MKEDTFNIKLEQLNNVNEIKDYKFKESIENIYFLGEFLKLFSNVGVFINIII